jgi:hypothetical protein
VFGQPADILRIKISIGKLKRFTLRLFGNLHCGNCSCKLDVVGLFYVTLPWEVLFYGSDGMLTGRVVVAKHQANVGRDKNPSPLARFQGSLGPEPFVEAGRQRGRQEKGRQEEEVDLLAYIFFVVSIGIRGFALRCLSEQRIQACTQVHCCDILSAAFNKQS